MTTKEDWLFRHEYFRERAEALRKQAADLLEQADECDKLADKAKSSAGHHEQETPQ